MPDLTIACPSFYRAGNVKTFGVFREEDMVLVVARRQLEEYRAAYPDARFDPHPDDLNGLPLVRQWIYDKYGDVFMCDDDVPFMLDYQERTEKVPREKAVSVVHRLADLAEQMGAYLYGCGDERNPLHYSPHRPFRLTGVVRGRAMGLRAGAKFFFPASRSVDDEMCLSGLNAYYHRFCLVDERYAMPGDEYTEGGLAFRRSQGTLLAWVEQLKVMFGDAVSSQPRATRSWWSLGVDRDPTARTTGGKLMTETTEKTTYLVRRFTFDDDHPDNWKIISSGLTLDEAQAHCRRDDTHGEGWFDGYESVQ